MNQSVKKMVIAGVAVIMSVTLIVSATYAWTTLSKAPAAENIQITLGGGHTILLAPDNVKEVDGEVYHYPGYFNDTLIFSRFDNYKYLNEVGSLLPVSTADGLNWFTPTYYDVTDPEVQNGEACVGDVKPIEFFKNDNELLNANLKEGETETGHYVYLDFWAVSPVTEYTLRVARGDESGGSHLIELPKIKESDGEFVLQPTDNTFASAARIGFLVNTAFADAKSYSVYKESRFYEGNYDLLAGAYHEKGNYPYDGDYRFTIYEPNGFAIPKSDDKRYVVTRPIGLVDEKPSLIDINDRLTVQQGNSWITNNNTISLDAMLKTAITGKNVTNAKQAEKILYVDYLQGQFSSYLTRGEFVTRTQELYETCENGSANASQLAGLKTSGATEDVYIVKLQKNIPQRIRMYIWIEGQDADCAQLTETGRFALSLELAGSNIDY